MATVIPKSQIPANVKQQMLRQQQREARKALQAAVQQATAAKLDIQAILRCVGAELEDLEIDAWAHRRMTESGTN